MKLKKTNVLIAAVLFCSMCFSQQLPQFSQYMFNTISVNPAYAGSRETLNATVLHRSQWLGIDRGPTTQTLSVHAPLENEKIGLGLSVINDSPGFENFVFVYGDFSYTIKTGEKTKLALGLKAGLTHYNLDQVFLNDPLVVEDPFFGNYSDRWNPNVGIGAYWHTNKWYLGLSAPRIINTDYNQTESSNGISYIAQERIGYYFTGGYVFDLSESTKLKPSFLIKATNGAPLSTDLTAHVLINDKFWIGGSYRNNINTSSLAALADFQITQEIRAGYSYDHYISDLRPFTGGTHEIILIYEVFKTKRIKSPRYF